MDNKNTKAILIGIDGATWDIIDPLINQGNLPNIEKLIRNGVKAKLQADPLISSPEAWTTIATGKAKEKHGVTHLLDGTNTLKSKRIWEILESRGKSIGVSGWPLAEPYKKGMKGFILPGSLSFTAKAYPSEYNFAGQIQGKFGLKKIIPAVFRSLFYGVKFKSVLDLVKIYAKKESHDSLERYIHKEFIKTHISKDIFAHALKKYKPEFSAHVMFHTDHLAHRLWMYHEPEKFSFPVPSKGIDKYGKYLYQSYIPLELG